MTISKRMGAQTIAFQHPPKLLSVATVAGPREGAGPLGQLYDLVVEDTLMGCKSWEQAETSLLESAVNICLKKANISVDKVQFLIAGDLLNQIISANYVARQVGVPFLGIYGACSTVSEGIAVASMIIDGGFAEYVLVATSSHHNTAERQYRYPTEFGNQRPPTAQWTVTGSAAILLTSGDGSGPAVTSATVGKVMDMGIKDPNDMGSAMAPAAADTIYRHLLDTGRRPQDYDAILTGDLGKVGKRIALQLLKQAGLDLGGVLDDCGTKIYSDLQDPHSGASGCACSGLVLGCSIWPKLAEGTLKRILLVATGSLHSPLSVQQGESIPAVAHAVCLEG